MKNFRFFGLEAVVAVAVGFLVSVAIVWTVGDYLDQPRIWKQSGRGEIVAVEVVEDGKVVLYPPSWQDQNPGSYEIVWVSPDYPVLTEPQLRFPKKE